jgi:hypothetical protein
MWIVRWENAPQGKLTTHEIDGAEMYCDKVVQRRPKVWRYEPKHGHGGDSRLCKPGVAAVDFTTTAALTAIEKMFIEEMVL